MLRFNKLLYSVSILFSVISLSACRSDVYIINQDKARLYPAIISKITDNAFPIFAEKDSGEKLESVYYAAYDSNREVKAIYKIKIIGNNLTLTEITNKPSYSYNTHTLYTEEGTQDKYNICYKPYADADKTDTIHEKYGHLSERELTEKINFARQLAKHEVCVSSTEISTQEETPNNAYSQEAKTAYFMEIKDIINSLPRHKREDYIDFAENYWLVSRHDNDYITYAKNKFELDIIEKPDKKIYPVIHSIRDVAKRSKISLSPNSEYFVINKKLSKGNNIDDIIIDSACIIFEKNSNDKWAYIEVIEPSWFYDVKGWVPLDVLGSINDDYFTKLDKTNYRSFNEHASPSLYNILKDVSSEVDTEVHIAIEKLAKQLIAEGQPTTSIRNVEVSENSTKDNFIIELSTSRANYTYNSKDKIIAKIESK